MREDYTNFSLEAQCILCGGQVQPVALLVPARQALLDNCNPASLISLCIGYSPEKYYVSAMTGGNTVRREATSTQERPAWF